MNKKVEIDGLHIRYNRECRADSPLAVLVFLHGWEGSSRSWESNIAELRDKFDCISLDMPGFGVSGEPKNVWGVAEYAQFLREFAQVLDLQKFVLIGKSFGGRVAMFFACKWPETLSKLVLVAAAGIERKSFVTQLRIGMAKTGKAVISLFGQNATESLRGLFYKTANIKKDKSNYKWEVKKLVTNTNLSGTAESITTPTLVIWGTDDKVLPLSIGKELSAKIKGSTFLENHGGHNSHQESSKDFNALVTEYLNRNYGSVFPSSGPFLIYTNQFKTFSGVRFRF